MSNIPKADASDEQQNERWLRFVMLMQRAFADQEHLAFLQLMMTPDERDALSTRLQIIDALMNGTVSQRELKKELGVGIATITRGANSLKMAPPALKAWLAVHLPAVSGQGRIGF